MSAFVKNILKILNYLLTLALLMAYVSIYISPEFFWPLAFLGLVFPFLVLANLAFAIFWIYKRKLLFLISLIALLIGIKDISKTYQIDFSSSDKVVTAEPTKQLTLMSYNVRIFNLVGQSEFGEEQKELFARIREMNPDIVCFQEFYVNDGKRLSLDTVREELPDLKYDHILWLSEGSRYKYGIATFSRYPIVKKGRIDFGESLNSTIFSDILIDKQRIRIFNNHLQSIRFNRNNYRFISNQNLYKEENKLKEIRDISDRLKEAFIKRSEQAKKISASIERSSYPSVVCGDFNDTPISYTYHTISSGLNDAFIEAGSGIGKTYLGKFPSYRIDYIFYDDAFEITGFEVIEDRFSDHYPLRASLKIVE